MLALFAQGVYVLGGKCPLGKCQGEHVRVSYALKEQGSLSGAKCNSRLTKRLSENH